MVGSSPFAARRKCDVELLRFFRPLMERRKSGNDWHRDGFTASSMLPDLANFYTQQIRSLAPRRVGKIPTLTNFVLIRALANASRLKSNLSC